MTTILYIRHTIGVFAYTLLVLICISPGKQVMANNHAIDCISEYTKLSEEHTNAVAHNKLGTSPYFKSLHAIEDKIFIAFQHCPKDTLLFTLMGEVQISLGNLQLANIYARKAFNWDQSIWQTHHLLGTTLAMQKDYETGLKHLEKAAEFAKDRPVLVFNLCSTYLVAKDYDRAIAACTEILQRKDHQLHGPALHIRGQAYQALKMAKKAKQDFKNARTLGYNQ